MSFFDKFKILTYNIGIIQKDIGSVLADDDNEIVWLKHKYKDRFFADPFLIKQDADFFYLLAEEYPFRTEKGVISLLKIKKTDFSLEEKRTIIDEPFHLSFPFCHENGNFIIPESSSVNETYLYTFDFEKMAVTSKKKIVDSGLIDGVYYKDYLFASKVVNPKKDLYLFKKADGTYQSCNGGKPIVSDLKFSRSAGLFFEYNGEVYRPTQDCTERYGKRIQITKIKEIDDCRFVYEATKTLESSKYLPFNETMHTFNAYDGFVIVDGSKDFLRFPMKLFYKLHKKLFRR